MTHDPIDAAAARRSRTGVRPALLLLAGLAAATLAGDGIAGQTRRFVLDTPRATADAIAQGIAVGTDGTLRALPPLVEVAKLDEPLGLALAIGRDGAAFVGTGHPARVYRFEGGAKQLVGELPADQVTALLVDPSGTLWAATAVPAVLYRMAPGEAKLVEASKLADGNLWDLAWFRGSLLAAAGNPGRLLRLGAKGLELAAEVPDRHARCLAVVGDSVIVGTSGKGLVLRWSGDGPLGVIYDSAFTEIAALAAAPDGSVYAAALTGDPTLGKPPKDEGGAVATVTVVAGDQSAAPPSTEKGTATSEILHILDVGAATSVHRFTKQLAGALAWSGNGLVIGTGLEGELWQIVDGAAAELDTIDAAQVVRLADGGRWVLVQGPVRLLRRSGAPHGTFTSPPLDAGQPSQWGEVDVRGELPAGTTCAMRFRSGAISQPDDAWSGWTAQQACSANAVKAPQARFLQWRLELTPPPAGDAWIEGVTVAYRQVNLPPEIKDLTVHEPGEVFLKSPPPSERIVDVRHPDLSGIFTTLSDETKDNDGRLGKKYYRVGYQTLSWKVEDPNGDPLRFTVEVLPHGSDRWIGVRSNLEESNLALDTQALPDGLYRFRLTATDAPANPEGAATVSALSSWVTVDNTPPRLSGRREHDTWVVTVEDALSPLTIIEWSRDGDTWHPAVTDDGAIDGRRETVRIPAAPGAHLLTVRAIDNHHNRATVALEEKE
jgi:hypothetical protein